MAGRHILRWGFAAALTVVSASATAAILDIGTLADDSTTTIGNAAGSGGNSIDTWLFDIANNGTLFEATLVSIGLTEYFVWDLQDGTATSLASGDASPLPWSTPLSLVAPIGLSAGSYSLQIENYAIPGSTYTIELVTGNGSADGGSFGGDGDGIGIPPPLPLPLPPAMLLMLTGLAGLGLVGSTRKG